MKIRFIGFLIALSMTGLSAVADDLEDLIAASDAVVARVDALDGEGVSQFLTDRRLASNTNNPALVVTDLDAVKADYEGLREAVDYHSFALNNRVARVFGDTGFTASTAVQSIQFKGESIRRTLGWRLFTTWSKIDGKWKIVGQHPSLARHLLRNAQLFPVVAGSSLNDSLTYHNAKCPPYHNIGLDLQL